VLENIYPQHQKHDQSPRYLTIHNFHGSVTDNKIKQQWALIDLLLPGGRELLGALVVAGKAVDPALNKNEPEFGVLILPVPLQMLPNCHSLLNQEVQVLRDLRRQPYTRTSDASVHHTSHITHEQSSRVTSSLTMGLKDAEDLATSNALDERDAVLVTEQDANLRRHLTLLRSLGNHLLHLPINSVIERQPTKPNRASQE